MSNAIRWNPGRWDPALYGRYADARLRPALDLLGRVQHDDPRLVHDAGTGRGEMARIMAERWPEARIVGSDLSEEMLAVAQSMPSRVEWRRIDLAEWSADAPIDVLYANAVLHWLDDHDLRFPRFLSSVASGGVFACQMPLSWAEPSHRLIRETLGRGGPGATPLGTVALRSRYARRPVADAEWYHDLLTPVAATLDIWETRYHQVLTGDDPVLEWVRGSALRHAEEELTASEWTRFIASYRDALRDAYPPRPDGTTLYPFPRLFIVAHR